MTLYIDGIKDGSNIESYNASMFLFNKIMPPLNTRLTLKQLKEHGFIPWLGQKPRSDYYIVRIFGATQ